MSETSQTGWRGRLPVLLIWSCIPLLPFGRSVELPVLIMAIWGIVLIVRNGPAWLWQGFNRPFTLMFLLMWIPMVLAVPDAVLFDKSLSTTAVHLRFYFAGIFIISVLRQPGQWSLFLRLASIVLIVWVADALIQALFGRNLLGFEAVPSRLNGLFGERHLKLGYVLAALSPLLIGYVQRMWPAGPRYLVYLGLGVVILLAGSRAGWVMAFVAMAAFVVWNWQQRGRIPWAGVAVAGVLMVAALITLYQYSEGFRQRVNQTMLVFEGNEQAVNEALSARLPVWSTALNMIADNPLTGVGPRGFRYAYPQVAAEDDPFLVPGEGIGAFHSHHLWIEVAAETGALGILGLLGFHIVALRLWFEADRSRRYTMLPAAVCLLAAIFPLNSHLAIYSSFWSQVIWWMVALYCGARARALSREDVNGEERVPNAVAPA